MIKSISIFLVIFLVSFWLYLPIIISPGLILNRGNDLEEQFWPVFNFIKQQIIENHSLPLWNNLWFSGMPLLADPQFSIFYPPNLLFILLPIDSAFIVSFLAHTLLGGLGIYLCARMIFRLSKAASFFTSILYISSPKLFGFLEAGHPGLVESWAFPPFVLLSTIKIAQNPKLSWSILLGVVLAGIFYTHTIIFLLSVILSILIFAGSLVFFINKRGWLKSSIFFLLAILVTFGLTAITLLPQILWSSQTTRFLLLNDRDVYPKWTGIKEYLEVIFIPWKGGFENIWAIDSEKWLAVGIFSVFLAIIGFFNLKTKFKMVFIIGGLVISLIALNNASPLYSFLLASDWYVLARVSTRVWFVFIILIAFLAGFGMETLLKKKIPKILLLVFAALTIAEMIALSWTRLAKPIPVESKFASQKIFEFLKNDSERFRVFCLNRCLSQKEAAKRNLELVDGYNTLQQNNYYKQMWQLSGTYWNYYTLSLPPIGTYIFEKLKPDAVSLGEFNTKYIISPYKLNDNKFILEDEVDDYLIYQNSAFLPRAYYQGESREPLGEARIITYTPNYIKVDTTSHAVSRLVLSEVWSPGWKAYLNGKKEVPVQEKPNTLRLVDIKPDTQFVDFRYQPEGFTFGRFITFITLAILLGIGIKWRRK